MLVVVFVTILQYPMCSNREVFCQTDTEIYSAYLFGKSQTSTKCKPYWKIVTSLQSIERSGCCKGIFVQKNDLENGMSVFSIRPDIWEISKAKLKSTFGIKLRATFTQPQPPILHHSAQEVRYYFQYHGHCQSVFILLHAQLIAP